MYMLPCNASRLAGGSISFGLVGWSVVTSVATGGLAVGLSAGGFAMEAALFMAFVGGTIGVVGPVKEIVFFSGTASGADTAAALADAGLSVAGGSVFAALCAAVTLGTMEAILSFSTNTYPKSVFTLNMLSSYATITP